MNNVETRIIRHDPPRCSYGSRVVTLIRVNVNTFRARNFCLTTRSAKLIADRYIYIYIYPNGTRSRLPISNRFFERADIFPRCLHRGKFRFFNLGRTYVHERLWRERLSTAMVAPSLQEVGNQTTFAHTPESAIPRRRNTGFIPTL